MSATPYRRRGLALPVAVVLAAATLTLTAATDLRVLLYPNIPDTSKDGFAALLASMTREFGQVAPDVHLTLVLDPALDVYNPDVLHTLLTKAGAGGFDVVEIDTVMLDAVASPDLTAPWDLDGPTLSTFTPLGLAAATVPGNPALLAFPHLACSNFLANRVPQGRGPLPTLAAVREAFETVVPPPSDVLVAGKLGGSWDLPTVYISSWMAAHPGASTQDAVNAVTARPLDATALASVEETLALCLQANGSNPCWDKGSEYWKSTPAAAAAVGKGAAVGAVGYSEVLLATLSSVGTNIQLMPYAVDNAHGGGHALGFVDAFVRAAACTGECASAATRFAKWATSQDTMAALLLSRDAPQGVQAAKRHLVSATLPVYNDPAIQQDPAFAQLANVARSDRLMPLNSGFSNPANIANLKADIVQALHLGAAANVPLKVAPDVALNSFAELDTLEL